MRRKTALALGFVVSLMFIISGLAFSQQEGAAGEQPVPQAPQPQAQTIAPTEPEILWLWGEVVSVDVSKKEILVKYLDYETDQDKEMTISVDDKTSYENVKAIDEIKAQNTASIDYIMSQDGKNLAQNISIEKADETLAPQEETSVEKPVTASDVAE